MRVCIVIMGHFQKEANLGLSTPNSRSGSFLILELCFLGQLSWDLIPFRHGQGQADFPRSAVLGTLYLSWEIGGRGGNRP